MNFKNKPVSIKFFSVLFVIIFGGVAQTFAATVFSPNQTLDPIVSDPSCTITSCYVNSVLSTSTIDILTATTTNTSNLIFTNATGNNATTTNLFSTLLSAVSSIFTNLFTTNATLTNATITNLYAPNFVLSNVNVSNGTITNATSTNIYTNLLTAISSIFTNLTATNLIGTNATISSATITNLYAPNILGAVATATFAQSTTIGATVTNATATGIFFLSASGTLTQDTANFSYDAVTKKLTVTGGIDPLYFQAKDVFNTNGAYYEAYNGNAAAVSGVNTGRLRYSTTTQQWEVSTNGGSYAPIAVTGGNISWLNATGGNATITNIFATSASITNATSTNFFTNLLNAISANIATLFGTTANFATSNASTSNATTTNANIANLLNASTSNLTSSNATITSATITNLSIGTLNPTNLTATNATITNSTTTNSNITNLVSGNSTSTNLFANVLNALLATFTNIIWTNATGTNATTTNLFSNIINSQQLSVTGTSTFATTTSTSISGNQLVIASGANVSTANTLYNVGGALYFNGSALGLASAGVDTVFFNGSGVRLSTTSNQLLIGGSATTTSAKLEVQGSASISGTSTFATTTNASSSITWLNVLTNLFAQLATIVNLNSTNATITNATTSNFVSSNSSLGAAIATTLTSGTTTLGTTTISTTTINVANINTANISNLNISGLSVPNATITNSTSSNISTTNFTATGTTLLNTLSAATTTLGTTTISTSTITNLNVLATLWANILSVLNFTSTNATITNATTTNLFATTASATSVFATNLNVDDSTLFVNSTSNSVGVGTTTLSSKFVVAGTGGTTLTVINDDTGSDASVRLVNRTGGNTRDYYLKADNVGNFNILDNSPTGGVRLQIDSTGKLTVGTTTLGTTTISTSTITNLNVLATLWASILSVLNFTSTNATITNATTTNIFATTASTTNLFVGATTTLNGLVFSDNNANAIPWKMYEATTGGLIFDYVGQQAKLSANGTFTLSGGLIVGLNATTGNATTTSLATGNLTATGTAIISSEVVTNSIQTNSTITSATITNLYAPNFQIPSVNVTNGTITNSTSTNLAVTGGITANTNRQVVSASGTVSAVQFDITGDGTNYNFDYNLDGTSDATDPVITLVRGLTYKFNMSASGHPFEFRVSNGGAQYTSGIQNNTTATGIVTFTVPFNAPNSLVYQCTSHAGMVGQIKIVNAGELSDDNGVTRVVANLSGIDIYGNISATSGVATFATTTIGTATIATSSITFLNVLNTLYANILSVLNLNATSATITNATTTNIFATTASATNIFSTNLNVDDNTLYVNSTNNSVAVGTTTNLSSKFTVAGTGGTIATIVNDDTGSDASVRLLNRAGGNTRDYYLKADNTGNFRILDNAAGGGTRLLIDSTGQVTLGTTTLATTTISTSTISWLNVLTNFFASIATILNLNSTNATITNATSTNFASTNISNTGLLTNTGTSTFSTTTILGTFELLSAVKDSFGATGTAGQVLSSTGTSTQWITSTATGVFVTSGGNVILASSTANLVLATNTLSTVSIGSTTAVASSTFGGTTTTAPALTVYGDIINSGVQWTAQQGAIDSFWNSVAYGNGLFVAVANAGVGNRIMTSSDGTNWISYAAPSTNSWRSVTYGNGLFVAVSSNGTGDRVMTSSDGITWTSRVSAADNTWTSVTYGNGLFVAVGITGGTDRVMTSPDGITWTSRNAPNSNNWFAVTYGNGQFVAVSTSGTGNRVMTSPDGITWTSRTSASDSTWSGITYGKGLFVSVAQSGTGNRVMTSTDGITWTSRTSAADNNWTSVVYGNGIFVATSQSGTRNRVMTSTDGITWTSRTSAADNNWNAITYGNGMFVSVGESGVGNRVMTSGKIEDASLASQNNNIFTTFVNFLAGLGIGTTTNIYGGELTSGITLGSKTINGTNIANTIVLASATGTANVATNTNALANVNGTLYFNGNTVGGGLLSAVGGTIQNSSTTAALVFNSQPSVSTTTNALYNNSGTLYFNGSALGAGGTFSGNFGENITAGDLVKIDASGNIKKIISAVAGASTTIASVGTQVTVDAGTNTQESIVQLNATQLVAVYKEAGNVNYLARIGSLNGTTTTWSSTFDTGISQTTYPQVGDLKPFGTDKFIFFARPTAAMAAGSPSIVKIGQVSGNSISFGTGRDVRADLGGTTTYGGYMYKFAQISSTKVIVAILNGGDSGVQTTYLFTYSLSGTSLTYDGNVTSVATDSCNCNSGGNTNWGDIIGSDTDRAVMVYDTASSGTTWRVRAVNLSGTTITFSAGTDGSGAGIGGSRIFRLAKADAQKVVISVTNDESTSGQVNSAGVIVQSGATISSANYANYTSVVPSATSVYKSGVACSETGICVIYNKNAGGSNGEVLIPVGATTSSPTIYAATQLNATAYNTTENVTGSQIAGSLTSNGLYTIITNVDSSSDDLVTRTFVMGSRNLVEAGSFAGIANTTITSGNTGSITLLSGLSTALTSLASGTLYYINESTGSLSTTVSNYVAGRALSSSTFQVLTNTFNSGTVTSSNSNALTLISDGSDSDTFLTTNADGFDEDKIRAYTAGQLRMSINANGAVGIGSNVLGNNTLLQVNATSSSITDSSAIFRVGDYSNGTTSIQANALGQVSVGTSTFDTYARMLVAGILRIASSSINGVSQGAALVIDSGTSSVATTTNALYNLNGALYFNGFMVGTSSQVQASYMKAGLSANQSTDMADDNHIKFQEVINNYGTDITLDTTTTYAPTNNVASRGRFTLKAGKTYKLTSNIHIVDSTIGTFYRFYWVNSDTGANIGAGTQNRNNSNGSIEFVGVASAIFTPAVDTRVEVRFQSGGLDTIYDDNGPLTNITTAEIEVIAGNSAVTGQSVDYVYAIPTGTNNTANATITLAVSSGNIAHTSGSLFQLKAGKTYSVESTLGCNGSGSVYYWFNIVDNNGVIIPNSSQGMCYSSGSTDNRSTTPATAVITPVTDMTISLRSGGNVVGNAIDNDRSYFKITQLGSSAITSESVLANGGQASGINATIGTLANNFFRIIASSTEYMRVLATGQGLVGTTTVNTTVGTSTLSIIGTTSAGTVNIFNVSSSSGVSFFNVANSGLATIGRSFSRLFGTTYEPGVLGTIHANDLQNVATTTSRIRVSATSTAFAGITGFAGGGDGQELTIVNASSTKSFTVYNQSASSTAANRIITGTAGDLTVAADASIVIVYDATSLRWRVVGGAGGGTTVSSTALSNFTASTSVGTAALTVDTFTNLNIAQASSSVILTLPNPSLTTAGKTITVNNTGTVAFTMYDTVITSAESGIFIWSGTAWKSITGKGNVAGEILVARASADQSVASIPDTTNLAISTTVSTNAFSITNSGGGTYTLKSGKTYQLNGSLSFVTNGSTFDEDFQWYDITGAAYLGSAGNYQDFAGDSATPQSQPVAVFTPSVDSVVAIRSASGAVSANITTLKTDSNITISVVAGNAPVTGQSVDFVQAGLTANQTGVGSLDDLVFNEVDSGSIPLNTTTGVFTLSAGKTYKLDAALSFEGFSDTVNGSMLVDWVDANTNGALILDRRGRYLPTTVTTADSFNGGPNIIYTPATNQTVKLRAVGVSGTATLNANRSSVTITQLGSSAVTSESTWGIGGNTFSDTVVKLFGSATSNAIAFVASSTEYMRLLATGQFLVGTTTINTTVGTSTFAIVGTTTNGTANIFNVSSSSGLSIFNISNGGGVGVGTTTNIYGGALTAGLTLNNAFVMSSSTALSTTTNALYNVNGSLYWNGTSLASQSLPASSTSLFVGTSGLVLVGTSTATASRLFVQGSLTDTNIFQAASSSGKVNMSLTANGTLVLASTSMSALPTYTSGGTTVEPRLQLYSNGNQVGSGNGLSLLSFSSIAGGSIPNAPGVIVSRTNSGTIGSYAALTAGQILGSFGFGGTDSTSALVQETAGIRAFATQNWSTGVRGTAMSFYTQTNSTAGSAVERMRINHDGTLSIGTTTIAGGFNYQAVATTSNIFSLASSTGANVLAISADGNIAASGRLSIGTTSALYATEITSSGSGSLRLSAPVGSDNTFTFNSRGIDNFSIRGTNGADAYLNSVNSAILYLGASGAGAGAATNMMSFSSSGNITAGGGSSNSGLFSISSSTMANSNVLFSVGSTTAGKALQITAAGFVNMGTTTFLGNTLSLQGVGNTSNNLLQLFTYDGAPAATFAGNGKVGIGTTTPEALFHVSNSADQIHMKIGNTLSSSASKLLIQNGWTGNDGRSLDIQNAAGTSQLTFTGAGRLGIGTSSPMNMLTVNGGIMHIAGTAAPGTLYDATSGSDYIFGANTAIAGAGIYDNTATAWRLMVKDTTGYVGIGTTTPTENLSIAGGNAIIGLRDNVTGTRGWLSRFTNRVSITSTDDVNIYGGATSEANGNGLVIQSNGVTRPSSNNTYTLGSASFRWTEVFATNGVINTSDARLKENVLDLSTKDGLDAVLALRPVTYNWIDKGAGNQKNFGFLAQDVYNINPELVSGTTTGSSTLGINYSNFIPLLTKAVQQLNNKIFSSKVITAISIEEITASSTISVDDKLRALGMNAKNVNDMLAQLASSTSATSSVTTTETVTYSTSTNSIWTNASGTACAFNIENGCNISSTTLVMVPSTTTTTIEELTFTGKLFAKITAWLASATNGITEIFVGKLNSKEVNTDKLCVKKVDGSSVCLTGEQVQQILDSSNNPPPTPPTPETPVTVTCSEGQILNPTTNLCEVIPSTPETNPVPEI